MSNNTNQAANVKSTEEKKVPFLNVEYAKDNSAVTFEVNDAARGFNQKLVFKLADVSDAIRVAATLHGFNQKIRDSAANCSGNAKKGIAADGPKAIEQMQATIDSLLAGAWNRTGGDGASQIKPKLAKAIARMMKVDVEVAAAKIEQQAEDAWRGWWNSPKVQEVWKQIELEEAKAKVKAAGEDASLTSLKAMFE